MAYKINDSCVGCDHCRPQCPTGAISVKSGQYSINPDLCNNCEGFHEEPQCVVQCPISVPVPSQAKRGRSKVSTRVATSPDLFPNGKNNPFASAIPIWEACNALAQRHSLPWQKEDETGKLSYQRTIQQKCLMTLRLTDAADTESPVALTGKQALVTLEQLDIRSTCMHLIYAAHATTLEKPWEQEFTISDRQIEDYLGLDKRKDLSKAAKLTLIKEIAQQPCFIKLIMNFPTQGRIKGFTLEKSRLWHLLDIQHHFQEDEEGCKHLVGLTFRLKAGMWAKFFLNKQGYKERTAYYQYSILPRSLLSVVMRIWQQHEGAARIMLWLLFKVRMGKEQRITVPTLMRVAYGEQKINHASLYREDRKRLLRAFESDLAVLHHYGLKPVFDPETYPPEIQPLWAKLTDLPEDAEEALEFWMNDGSNEVRLTDAGPRGKWNLLMNARILWFELPADWEQPSANWEKKKRRSQQRSAHNSHSFSAQSGRQRGKRSLHQSSPTESILTGEQVAAARKHQGLSQRDLAEKTGKSQSWIRDIENKRFNAKLEDQILLRKALGLG
jgi:NAD-dependent dihydropyrimidine dehydrogenase PreA subunit/DNA-binding transcriptional regulator YiaG